jgi:hypothetical protein
VNVEISGSGQFSPDNKSRLQTDGGFSVTNIC